MNKTLQNITRKVTAVTGLSTLQIKSKSRDQDKVFSRMVIALIAYQHYSITQSEIAQFLKLSQAAVNHYLTTIKMDIEHNNQCRLIYQKVLLKLSEKTKIKPAAPKYTLFEKICKSELNKIPTKEFKFHPVRKWRFDFAFLSEKVAVEIEGGVWMSSKGGKSRHFSGTGALNDMEKYSNAAALGWRVLRFTPQNIYNQESIQLIKKALECKIL